LEICDGGRNFFSEKVPMVYVAVVEYSPYCNRKFKGENLKHLLGCAKANPEDKEKLQKFFQN